MLRAAGSQGPRPSDCSGRDLEFCRNELRRADAEFAVVGEGDRGHDREAVTLARLEKAGLVSSSRVGQADRPDREVYGLTEAGRDRVTSRDRESAAPGARLVARRTRRTVLTAASLMIAVAMVVAALAVQRDIAVERKGHATVGFFFVSGTVQSANHVPLVLSVILVTLTAISAIFSDALGRDSFFTSARVPIAQLRQTAIAVSCTRGR